ncbi:MAG TPA: hypothetical protein VMY99_04080 [Nevskiaceae bacterium]|nr:hypothetical protein [Nevskiaceae bacterium]
MSGDVLQQPSYSERLPEIQQSVAAAVEALYKEDPEAFETGFSRGATLPADEDAARTVIDTVGPDAGEPYTFAFIAGANSARGKDTQ